MGLCPHFFFAGGFFLNFVLLGGDGFTLTS